MSGYLARNPLMTDNAQFAPPPQDAIRPTVLPNPLATPAGDWRDTIAPQPTQADAADATAKAYTEWLARDRAEQIRLGHVDPATGQLTPEGWRAQAQTVAGGFGPADIGAVGNALGTIKAYHGSPHSFERFDMSKIGTGEGAQAYGHGLYFAENEGIARGYRDKLAREAMPAIDLGTGKGPQPLDQIIKGEKLTEAQRIAFLDFTDAGGDWDKAHAAVPNQYYPEMVAKYQGHLADLRAAYPNARVQQPGHLYEVNLNAEPDQMLHWDKPLSEQSPHVQERLGKVGLAPGGVKERAEYLASLPNDELRAAATRALDSPHDPYGDAWMPTWDTLQKGAPNIDHNAIWDIRVARNSPEGWGYRREGTTGDELYRSLGDPVAAAAALRAAGIPGISYLDAGSRGGGQGSRNHVMFDDATIDILRKYGIAGLIGGGAAATAAGGNQGQNQ